MALSWRCSWRDNISGWVLFFCHICHLSFWTFAKLYWCIESAMWACCPQVCVGYFWVLWNSLTRDSKLPVLANVNASVCLKQTRSYKMLSDHIKSILNCCTELYSKSYKCSCCLRERLKPCLLEFGCVIVCFGKIVQKLLDTSQEVLAEITFSLHEDASHQSAIWELLLISVAISNSHCWGETDSQGAHKLLVLTVTAALSAETILHDAERIASCLSFTDNNKLCLLFP